MAEKLNDKPKPNVAPEDVMAFYRDIRDATKAKDEAVAKLRTIRKRGENLGINLKAFDFHARLEKLDDDERELLIRDAARIGDWVGKPIGFQGALFGDDAPKPKEKAMAEHKEWLAREAGKAAGMAGTQQRGDNPYEAGSPLHAAWDDGWREGDAWAFEQKKNAEKLGGPVKRGARKGRGNPEDRPAP